MTRNKKLAGPAIHPGDVLADDARPLDDGEGLDYRALADDDVALDDDSWVDFALDAGSARVDQGILAFHHFPGVPEFLQLLEGAGGKVFEVVVEAPFLQNFWVHAPITFRISDAMDCASLLISVWCLPSIMTRARFSVPE